MLFEKWPPIRWLWDEYRVNAAWYSGSPDQLLANTAGFWQGNEKTKVHVPLAGDLASLAAGLLFCGSPTIKSEDKATNDRIQEIYERCGLYQKLLQAAELQAPFGGVFVKWNWDKAQADYPLLRVVPADAGLPFYRNGMLYKCVFWSVVREDDEDVIWRTEETYSADGSITTRLLKGSRTLMGNEQPLTEIDETSSIAPEVKSGAGVLLATYVPARLPNRIRPYSAYGRSDYDGLRTLFSALDEAYSSMMRDVKLGKTTIIVPADYLRQKSLIFQAIDGYNAENPEAPRFTFATDDEVFVALDFTPENPSGGDIKPNQPNIRAEEHQQVINDIVKRIITLAGYSPQSEGIDIDGRAESGTALNVRERRSLQTAETKKTYWWHALMDITRAGLALDASIFGGQYKPDAKITVEFADNSQPDMQTQADVLDKCERAGAMSTETKVRYLHPDWNDTDVAEEVALINQERGNIADGEPDAGLGDIETHTA